MSIFNDRIVLKDGNVIMPNEIHGITTNGVVYGIELHDGSYMVVAPNKIRTDRPTGMVDSTGKEIFERDRVVMDDKTGVVKFSDAAFDVVWDEQTSWGNEGGLWTVNARLTITGMGQAGLGRCPSPDSDWREKDCQAFKRELEGE